MPALHGWGREVSHPLQGQRQCAGPGVGGYQGLDINFLLLQFIVTVHVTSVDRDVLARGGQ